MLRFLKTGMLSPRLMKPMILWLIFGKFFQNYGFKPERQRTILNSLF